MKQRRFFRIISLLCALAMLCAAPAGCAASYTERTTFAMGSVLSARLYAPAEQADALFERITDSVSKADGCLSANDPASEVSAANAKGSANVSAYTRKALEDMVTLCNILGGSVDVTVGALTQLWGFSTDAPHKPDAAQIEQALGTVGLQKLLIDNTNGTVVLGEGQKLDPGAFGKGFALDGARDALRTGSCSAVVSFGGSVLLYGKPKSGKSWTVGVRDPFGNENDRFATLSFSPESGGYVGFISTSGSYEKTFTEDGVAYHHILSPKTGYPVENGLVSVTVYGPGGITTDALSTACFVNGLNPETMRWIENFSAEAVFVFADKTYYVTDGLKDAFSLNDDSFTLREYEG